ncbi:TIGR03943 family protein [Brevibacillus sp. NSP2.1]|uniref:TIGR03943 family putative permease subunit n=1 Tax=Brevibacillus sp. NSP2.1 TaxID=3003229 RepID=UPI00041CDA43|nr:TIGR03943 family protein [Brevibacillus sp. NSP2.1]QHZ57230.1 TIGR03943 family protein [Brevibacillus sp. NSP2.1]
MEQTNWTRHYLMRSLILAGFAALLSYLIWTEKLGHYLAPKLHMLSYVTLGILVILTIVSVRQLFSKNRAYECDCEEAHQVPRTRWGSLVIYSLFLLPIFMGFFMPDKILGSAVAENRGVTLLSSDARKLAAVATGAGQPEAASQPSGEQGGQAAPPEQTGEDTSPSQQANAPVVVETTGEGQKGDQQQTPQQSAQPQAIEQAVPADATAANPTASGTAQATSGASPSMTDEELKRYFSGGGFGDFYTDIAASMYRQPVISLHDKIFLDGLTTLELYAKDFAGKQLETLGFVYREPGLGDKQFVVARFSVTCCTADASVFGILVESEDAGKWAKDSWVKVQGKLELRQVDGYDMLVLKDAKIQAVKAPKDPYVYYSYEAADITP